MRRPPAPRVGSAKPLVPRPCGRSRDQRTSSTTQHLALTCCTTRGATGAPTSGCCQRSARWFRVGRGGTSSTGLCGPREFRQPNPNQYCALPRAGCGRPTLSSPPFSEVVPGGAGRLSVGLARAGERRSRRGVKKAAPSGTGTPRQTGVTLSCGQLAPLPRDCRYALAEIFWSPMSLRTDPRRYCLRLHGQACQVPGGLHQACLPARKARCRRESAPRLTLRRHLTATRALPRPPGGNANLPGGEAGDQLSSST